jgi:hypothetical protein
MRLVQLVKGCPGKPEALLVAGGYLGGTIVFVYGERVLKQPETPVREALIPGRADEFSTRERS